MATGEETPGEATSFQDCYQQFTGYSGTSDTGIERQARRYTVVRHTGSVLTHPSLKMGMVGLGSVMTAVTASFLLSDDFSTPLASAPLSYSIPSQAYSTGTSSLVAQSPTSVSPDASAVVLPEFSIN